ncbi:MAG: prolyl oligopeptidase family serine peptidase [candidate division Zixibacteria bacterium]|nr:prolyl oligopeptidase family serine peptidase [candidate division Zixibacteria bacterium]
MVAFATTALAALPSLIPKEVIFGNPERAQARISPDGTMMSYLAPVDNVLNIWVRTIGEEDDRVVTNDTLRGIRAHYWAQDNKHIIYPQDVGGDENWHVYSVDIESKTTANLTPFEGVRADLAAIDPNYPDQLLVTMNKRDPTVFDIFNININSGEATLVGQNPGNIVGWIPDNDFKVRGAMETTPDGGFNVLVRDTEADEFRTLLHWGPQDGDGTPYGFTPDGEGLYVADPLESNVSVLKRINTTTGDETIIASDPRVDVGGVMIHPTEYHVEAVAFNYDQDRWQIVDSTLVDDFEAIRDITPGEFSIVSRDLEDDTWLIAYSSDVKPTQYYSFDRNTKQGTYLFTTRPELEEYTLAPMTFVEIESRDGLTLPSFLTLPVGIEQTNLPIVLLVHGGPWARDYWGYHPEVQWMANRGYAVLQVNFRGSTGFGKEFLHAGDKEWGRKMQNDLTDAVRWAIDQGYADPEKVAIYGGSYGGYAALAGAAFTPDLYTCAVDIVGPSNIITLIESIPPYWEPMMKLFYNRVGDPNTEEEMLKQRSPLFSADKIEIPMLIGQGANDPRVKQAESEQIVAALKANEAYVEYVVYPDEGHGFARPENRLDFYGKTENFLARYLDGRVEE